MIPLAPMIGAPSNRARAARWLAAAVVLAAAACGDHLSLRVEVHHPADAAVARTVVSIYESSTTTCAQIEYGDLTAAQLAALLVAEQALGADPGGALDGISRLDRKLVVARGFAADGRLVTAGCAQQDAITGRDVARVDTDFAATLSVGAVDPAQPGLPLTLTDADGRALARHPVTWRVYGPDGAAAGDTGAALAPGPDGSWELAAPACTGDGGVARVHPVPPSTVGGYAIALRPSWPAQPGTLLTSLTKVDPTLTEALPKPGVLRPCAIRVAGATRRLVCLQLSAVGGLPIAREYEVTVQSGNARLTARATAAVDAKAIGLVSVERGAAVRDVYAITTDAQVLGVFGPSVAPDPSPHLAAGAVADAALLPACEVGQAAQLVLRVDTATDKRLQAMPPLGGAITDYHGVATEAALELDLRGTGCVTELVRTGGAPRRRQAAIVDVTQRLLTGLRPTSSAVFECDLPDPTRCRVSLPVAEAGAGLSAPPRAAAPAAPEEEPRLTGMFFDASGVVMSSWVLLPVATGEFLLVERERVPSASIPRIVVSGQFDGDGLADMFWDLPSLNQQTSNLQVTYGRRIGAQRLSAISGQQPIQVADVLTGDLTGDGIDEIVLVGRQRRDDQTIAEGVIVVPMDVPIPSSDPGFDRPCP
jgi:hypothetical protein